jgi:hypothetical protein
MKTKHLDTTRIATRSEHVTPVGGNIFLDLGFPPAEAAAMHADSQRQITRKFARKAVGLTASQRSAGLDRLADDLTDTVKAKISMEVQFITGKLEGLLVAYEHAGIFTSEEVGAYRRKIQS